MNRTIQLYEKLPKEVQQYILEEQFVNIVEKSNVKEGFDWLKFFEDIKDFVPIISFQPIFKGDEPKVYYKKAYEDKVQVPKQCKKCDMEHDEKLVWKPRINIILDSETIDFRRRRGLLWASAAETLIDQLTIKLKHQAKFQEFYYYSDLLNDMESLIVKNFGRGQLNYLLLHASLEGIVETPDIRVVYTDKLEEDTGIAFYQGPGFFDKPVIFTYQILDNGRETDMLLYIPDSNMFTGFKIKKEK